jgi:segregation and condensation protein A
VAYSVDLEIYCGPLDLLLYLIEKDEVDIYDIPISTILEKYLEHLERAEQLDINLAAEFLVMASTLMEIKSRMLLPVEDRPPEEQDEEDPRGELVRQILALRAFKEAALALGEMQEIRSRRYGRGRPVMLPGDDAPPEPEPLKEASVYRLGSAYAQLVKQTLGTGPRTILFDEISMEERVEIIMRALVERSEFALEALFGERRNVVEKVGTFFALLEMVRDRKVRIYQNAEFGEILVQRWQEPTVDGPEPAGSYVEPYLPQPTRIPAEGEKRGWRRRGGFDGFAKDEIEADLPPATDDAEVRLNRRIDEILARADDISERFETSRAGKFRDDEGEADASKGLDQAMAAFDGEIGVEADPADADRPDTPPGPPSDGPEGPVGPEGPDGPEGPGQGSAPA